MKIAIINNIYPPYHRGGAEQVVVKTAQGLADLGHEVVILTTTPDKNADDFSTEQNIKIYRIHPPNLYFYTDAHQHNFLVRFLWHVIDIFNFRVSHWVRDILEKEQPDIVHTHNLIGMSFLIPRVIRKLHMRHIHTVHDVQLVEPSAMILKSKENSWRYTGLPTRVYTWIMKKLMGSPHVVISPSQFLLDFYTSRGFFPHSKKTQVRNPLTFDYKGKRNKEKGVKKNEKTDIDFLYLGQIEHHKGVLVLIEAFKKLKSGRLHIVGSGSQFEEVKQLVADDERIKIYGRVERAELPKLFEQMDVTVVPSLCYENSPTVIFESLYFGLPVIASRIEGIAELIEEGESGMTCEAGDVQSLYEKLQWCIDNKDKLEDMSKKTTQILAGLIRGKYIEKLVGLYDA